MKDRQEIPPVVAGTGRRVLAHAAAGALAGYLVLHPLSVHVYHVFELRRYDLPLILREAFSPVHLPMALYFTLIGALIGCAYAVFSVRLARLYEQVRELSLTDALTGAHNRRYLMQRLEEEVERCLRYGHGLALVMADIDHFKRFNDTHGHRAGDRLLQAVAAVLRSHVRRPDFVARYGGEEFAIVMPETDGEQAWSLAERVRRDIAALPAPAAGARVGGGVTMSFGVAAAPADASDAAALVEEADRALYHAKGSGRNLVVRRTQLPTA